MRKSLELSDPEIRQEGWKVLTQRLGLSGAMRFLLQYEQGYNDYSKEREELFQDLKINDLTKELRKRKNPKP
ncbi:MAG: hypothetical protein NT009_03635 [Proteobacteria bacterium]|nr:hypothetical protein [Pseudomonadota bacterium]